MGEWGGGGGGGGGLTVCFRVPCFCLHSTNFAHL